LIHDRGIPYRNGSLSKWLASLRFISDKERPGRGSILGERPWMGCSSTEVKRSEASHEGEECPICGR